MLGMTTKRHKIRPMTSIGAVSPPKINVAFAFTKWIAPKIGAIVLAALGWYAVKDRLAVDEEVKANRAEVNELKKHVAEIDKQQAVLLSITIRIDTAVNNLVEMHMKPGKVGVK